MDGAMGVDIGYGYTKYFANDGTTERKGIFPTAVSRYARHCLSGTGYLRCV